jgi:rhamnose utilization protein RhaD (predicted bifunctional aldolase and dehydrogenase)/NAD(P)-dependent dehydrogenase (short-subunit alcohol dehydrogenase family)
MKNRWSDNKAAQFIKKFRKVCGQDLAARLYSASLIGAEDSLVLHGGGNSSVKTAYTDLFGKKIDAIYVKASGYSMASVDPHAYTGLDLSYLKSLRSLSMLSDTEMSNAFRANSLDSNSAAPSIETLVHVLIPGKFVDHTHPDAILAVSNQADGEKRLKEALGETVPLLPYYPSGFKLAKAVAEVLDSNPATSAIVLMQHGLVTWGATAKESYETTITLVHKAEKYISRHARTAPRTKGARALQLARKRFIRIAPIIRGVLAQPTGQQDRPWETSIIQPLINREILDLLDSGKGREIALTPPLTSDHLIRTKAFYLWIENPEYEDPSKLRSKLTEAVNDYAEAYNTYIDRHSNRMPAGVKRLDPLPRVILLPGMGAICIGKNVKDSTIVRDITAHTLSVKRQIAAMGVYRGLDEEDLFDMEYKTLQHSKLKQNISLPLERKTALITGAAGAIGSGIAQELLEQGCHVAVTDLESKSLSELGEELKNQFGSRVLDIPMDVCVPQSVSEGFNSVINTWGGVDIVILNAGIAHVSALEDMSLEAFRKLETINVDGILNMLSESARLFKLQGTGGDIVLISTKNVFAPGARFGAYSATKAAAHQLARIASQEFAEFDVRVNMVSPDAVFSHGNRKSGLWNKIGPDRMAARGLSAEGLEEYYRNRNLLKARITARHVAKAVLFFVTRQTPTTGATIPVDGGLPDATPR